MKSRILLSLVIFLLVIMPVAAQTTPEGIVAAEAMIPADFAAFVQVRLQTSTGVSPLQVATFAAAFVQPSRIDFSQFAGYDTLFPMSILDAEDVTFSQVIQPWVRDEVVLAYRAFGDEFAISSENILMIIPTTDVLQAAAAMTPIIQFQDSQAREDYLGTTIYIGDRTAFAFVPDMVFIGATDLIKSALDVRAGNAARLIDLPEYQKVTASRNRESLVFGYIGGANARSVLSLLLNADTSAEPILQSLGETLKATDGGQGTFEAALLTSSLDAVGVDVKVDPIPSLPGGAFIIGELARPIKVRAEVTFYTSDATSFGPETALDTSVLNLVPQNALIMQSGSDARTTFYDALYTLPLTNFAGSILGGFPIAESIGVQAEAITAPSAAELQNAVDSFVTILESVGDFSLEDDLVSYFSGGYAVVLLPHPNTLTPVINTPYDIVMIVQVDAEAALDGVIHLIETVGGLDLEGIQEETIGDVPFKSLYQADTGNVVVRMGIVDNMLVIATGDSLQAVMDARDGNNRLIDRERWVEVTEGNVPDLYVNLDSMLNTFFGAGGRPASRQTSALAANGRAISEGIFQLNITMTLPTA